MSSSGAPAPTAAMAVDDTEDDQLAPMSTEDIIRASCLLDKDELQWTNLELESFRVRLHSPISTLAFTILKDLFWFYTNLKTYTRNLAFTILMWQQASDCRPAVVENFMWQQVPKPGLNSSLSLYKSFVSVVAYISQWLLPCHLTSLLLCLAFKVAMKTRLALARHGAVGAARYSEDTATVSDEDLGTLQSDQS